MLARLGASKGHGRDSLMGFAAVLVSRDTMETITETITATATLTYTAVYLDLPSGGVARVDMTATAGELFISGLLLLIFFVFIWQAIERLSNFNAKR